MTGPAKREIEYLIVENIEVHDRARPVSDEAVETLASSMSRIGLRTPISVRYYPERPDTVPAGETDDALILMTGAHRLAAAKRLGWEKIECFVYQDGDEIDAQLWEIAENLHRADLTKEQRDEHIRRYAELLAERETGDANCVGSLNDGRKAGPQHKLGIASQIAAETGVSKDTVRRALNPARARVEREKAADRKELRAEAEEKLAQLLAEYVPGELWDALKANLHIVGCKKVAAELERLVGVSVFDRTTVGSREGQSYADQKGRGEVTIVDREDEDGNHVRITVSPEIAEILARGEADAETGELLDTNSDATAPAPEANGLSPRATNEPEAAAEAAGDYLREPVAAEQGQIIREGDAPRETGRHYGGDASRPDAELRHEKPDCLEPASCKLGFTEALCWRCNDARMKARAST